MIAKALAEAALLCEAAPRCAARETTSPLGAIKWIVLQQQPKPIGDTALQSGASLRSTSEISVAQADEKIVRVTSETWGTHWAIRDMFFGLWRTRYPLDDSEAWSRDLGQMVKYPTRTDAWEGLREMWQQRQAMIEGDS